jgi:ABC-type multidrug transport system fused ATPase/permease subunit
MTLPIPNATVGQANDRGEDFLAMPLGPHGQVDPAVYTAWKNHIINGFKQNNEMFKGVLDAFMRPYWMTVWMYRILFAVGLLGFLAAAVLGVLRGVAFAAVFGGISVVTFLAFFIGQPLRALEQNLEFITWLGIIYNTYWTRLMYTNDVATVQNDLEAITHSAVESIQQLIDKHAELAGKRLGTQTENTAPKS